MSSITTVHEVVCLDKKVILCYSFSIMNRYSRSLQRMATDFVLFLKTIRHPDHARALALTFAPIICIVFDRPITIEQINWVQYSLEQDPFRTLIPQEQKALISNIRDALIRHRATIHS